MKANTIEKIVMSVYDWVTELEYIESVDRVSVNDNCDSNYIHSLSAPVTTGLMKYVQTDYQYNEDIIIRICSNEIDICRTIHNLSECLGYKHMFTIRIDNKRVSDITAELMFAILETLKDCR